MSTSEITAYLAGVEHAETHRLTVENWHTWVDRPALFLTPERAAVVDRLGWDQFMMWVGRGVLEAVQCHG